MSKTVKRYDCSSGGAKFCQGCYTMEECDHGDYVQHEDYARLKQECDKLAALLADVKADYTHAIHWEDLHSTMKRIDAALSLKP